MRQLHNNFNPLPAHQKYPGLRTVTASLAALMVLSACSNETPQYPPAPPVLETGQTNIEPLPVIIAIDTTPPKVGKAVCFYKQHYPEGADVLCDINNVDSTPTVNPPVGSFTITSCIRSEGAPMPLTTEGLKYWGEQQDFVRDNFDRLITDPREAVDGQPCIQQIPATENAILFAQTHLDEDRFLTPVVVQ